MTRGPHSPAARSVAACYFAAQGVAGLAWWVALLVAPALREPFVARHSPEATLLALAPADLVVFVVGSLAASAGIARRTSWAAPAAWITAGGAGYAALYCVGLAWIAKASWLGAALMVPAAAASLVAAGVAARARP